ncbi:MAG: glycine betaine/L-proline ABC transporter ATP-binding protein [Tissierellia bacterium]|jgi:glycine betaine/proline transport system ATP-binding protein|nr:glycine betaine/L-proline ABC transporter ATP-binding protein [Tissierellia bacterium]
MKAKIKVENLIKIFGNKPGSAVKRLKEGQSKAQILKETGQTVGVNGVSFDVYEGEMFVIMGLSGSGKSTLIRCLNLLNKPTSGNIFVDDENIVKYDKNEIREFRKEKMAMVFQHFGLFTHRTVLSNVEYGMEVKGIPKAERQKIAMDMIETVGLSGYANQYPKELSGGMQQRVGLARALANDPDILLMDEPFSALDPLIRREMQLELISIQSKLQKTIIFITHDINEAFRLGDRVAVMKEGKVVQIGTPEEILTEPSDEYIEDFVKDIDRTKIMQAKNIMWQSTALGFIKDGPNVALKEMRNNALSSLFIVDRDLRLQGIIKVDETIEAIKEKKKLVDILKHDYLTTSPDTYIQDLLTMATETNYPIAVVDDENKLLGIIVRSTILGGLVQSNSNNGDSE